MPRSAGPTGEPRAGRRGPGRRWPRSARTPWSPRWSSGSRAGAPAAGADGGPVLVGPGDDAAVLALDGPLVTSTDTLVQDVDFRLDWSSGHEVGRKAAVQVLADVEAMGAVPVGIVLALVVPGRTPVAWCLDLADGLAAEAAARGRRRARRRRGRRRRAGAHRDVVRGAGGGAAARCGGTGRGRATWWRSGRPGRRSGRRPPAWRCCSRAGRAAGTADDGPGGRGSGTPSSGSSPCTAPPASTTPPARAPAGRGDVDDRRQRRAGAGRDPGGPGLRRGRGARRRPSLRPVGRPGARWPACWATTPRSGC